jgi:hypothetical protein
MTEASLGSASALFITSSSEKSGHIPMTEVSNTQTVVLAYPIAYEGRSIDSITLRRPRVGDTVAAQRDATSQAELEIRLFAALTGLPTAAIELLDMKDYATLQQALKDIVSV